MVSYDEVFDARLAAFRRAAADLLEAWEAPDEGIDVDGYPEYLPSFDECVLDLAAIERRREEVSR
jgi:hypothetical protein